MAPTPNRIGLSLSGGGYRAAAFHLGTLRMLRKLQILDRVEVISSISGGSIAAACYALNKDNYDRFDKDLYNTLRTGNVIKKILFSWCFLQLLIVTAIFMVPAFYFLFTPYAWLFPVILTIFILVLMKYQFKIFPVSRRIEEIYDRFFYNNKTLGQLPEHPVLVIGSTNIETARPFTFSRDWMGDSTYRFRPDPIAFKPAAFPVSRAVMASSCVPFAFTPISIDRKFYANPNDADKISPVLVDGGVYDNQGIHKIMQKGRYACDTVITSDAGTGTPAPLHFKNAIALLTETVNVFMARIKNAQMVKDVYGNASGANKQIAYFSLSWDVENCIPGFIDNLAAKQITPAVIEAHELKPEWVADPNKFRAEIQTYLEKKTGYVTIPKPTPEEKALARKVGTNLTALSQRRLDCLIKQAEALTELQVKLYCPLLFKRVIEDGYITSSHI